LELSDSNKTRKRVIVNVNRMKKCYSSPSKARPFKRAVPKPKCLTASSDSDNDDDSLDVMLRSQPLPVSNERVQNDPNVEDEDVIVNETIELDDTIRDPTWRPGQVIQTRENSEDDQEVSQGILW
jgi:hypothetical protein